jgi:hypothetical protein
VIIIINNDEENYRPLECAFVPGIDEFQGPPIPCTTWVGALGRS